MILFGCCDKISAEKSPIAAKFITAEAGTVNQWEKEEVRLKIIGRKKEIRTLETCERSSKSEFVCVYGRRRVGKTYLIEQTFRNAFAFRATGVEGGDTRTQLRSFHQRLKEQGAMQQAAPKDWFENLADAFS